MKKISLCSIICLCLTGYTTYAEESKPPAPPQRTRISSYQVTIPLVEVSPRPVIEAYINGQGPFQFILDTGAEGSLLFDDLTRKLKLPVTGSAKMGGPDDPEGIEVDRVHIDTMTIGGVTLYDFDVDAWNAPEHMKRSLGDVRGILGISLFADGLITFDFSNKKLLFERGSLPEPDGKSILQWQDVGDTLPAVSLNVAGYKVNAHIDSGAPGTFSFADKFRQQFQLATEAKVIGHARTVTGEFVIRRAIVDGAVQLGEYTFDHPNVSFLSMLDDKGVGNIGSEILKQFVVTFDQKNRCIRWIKADSDKPLNSHSKIHRTHSSP